MSAPGTAEVLVARAWNDPVVDAMGVDPRSAYVERFWLGMLGPSVVWLSRRLVDELEHSPAGVTLDLTALAADLGLRHGGGKHSAMSRTIARAVQYGVARTAARPVEGVVELDVRRKLPPLTRRQVERLRPGLQVAHECFDGRGRPDADRRRARTLALRLVAMGHDRDEAERHLRGCGVAQAISGEATSWAWQVHRQSLEAESLADDLTPADGGSRLAA